MMQEDLKFCQSCGMPMQTAEDFGTETGGKPNEDYCVYCYKEGAFTQECTMSEMIQFCAEYFDEFRGENGKTYTREEAIASMQEFFPTLKRWQK